MVATLGLIGLRPAPSSVAQVVTPPYDVIKEGTPLEACLAGRQDSLFHVILGDEPRASLDGLRERGALVEDDEAAYYVMEQRWTDASGAPAVRRGVYLAAEVSDYSERQVIRHEKTFDSKVAGRIALANATEHTIGPVFLLTKGALSPAFDRAAEQAPLYDYAATYEGTCDLSGVATKVWRVAQTSALGVQIQAAIAPHPLYIADGHHRYHAALRGGQTHLLAYVTEEAQILAYDRVVNGVTPFSEVRDSLPLEPAERFATPAKGQACLYERGGKCWTLPFAKIPSDVVGRLDCSVLERELYPELGLAHEHIVDPAHFDYYPESALDDMRAVVDAGRYELAIALHPVSIEELIAVADAGLEDSSVVMPEKSTFFAPKIPSGLFLYRHQKR